MDFEKEIAAAKLAAMIDTDGCISFWRRKQAYGIYVGPRITFVNTNRRLVEHFASLCGRLGVNHSPVFDRMPHDLKNHKHKFVVNVSKRRDITRLLTWALHYLVGKKAQGALLFEIANYKVKRGNGQPQWIFDYADRISARNRRGPKSLPIASTS